MASGQLGWFLPSVLPIPRQGKQVKGVFLFFFGGGLVGCGRRVICTECVLVGTEEDVGCPALLLFVLSFTSLH